MRVVKFMSSWDNDFTSWPKHHQLLFGGQSVELPLSLHWFPWLPPGGYQRLSCEKSEVKIQSFDVWRTLTPTGVKGCRNRVTCRSQVMRPQGPLMPCTPRCYPANTVRDSQLKLEKCQILGYGWGGAAPYDPINPYLGGNTRKNEPLFTCLFIYAHFGNLILELNMVPGVLLEPYMSQGHQGVTETPIVSKGLRSGWAGNT